MIGCAPVDEDQARTAWIRDTLARDNEIWLSRDQELLAEKYQKMAADPFDFVRGTAGLFYADVAAPHPDRPETIFLVVPEATSVLLAGDPHPENLGTMLPADLLPAAGGALQFEISDLDGATFGPYLVDVRRGALGLATLAAGIDGCDADCRDATVAAYAQAYVDVMLSGEAPAQPCGVEADGPIVQALCDQAGRDGPTDAALEKYTTVDGDGVRRLALDDALDDAGKGILPLTHAESDQLARLLARWDRAPAGFRVLDAARRYGMGVASFPAVRYAVLWDTGDDGLADDALLNLREEVDPPLPPGRSSTVPGLFPDNAARIEQVAWMLWSRPDADPRMAGLADGAQAFKLTTWSGWDQGFDHVDIAALLADSATSPDAALPPFGALVGRSLAAAHARGVTSAGTSAQEAIAADLGARGLEFVAERVADATLDLAQSEADQPLFQRALDLYGPLLGADTLVTDAPR